MLGATKPVRPPTLPRPMATPKLGSSLNLHSLMRPMRAFGGAAQENSRSIVDSPAAPFTGGILSTGGGRADDIQMHVPNRSYVVPAWAVSHMGDGNTVNGLTSLKMMFGSPWGAQMGAPQPAGMPRGKGVGIPKPPPMHFQPPNFYPQGMSEENPALETRSAHGGAALGGNGAVPINASGGEFVITPDEVARIGDGDPAKGHRILDGWVLTLKKEAVDTLKKLPGPAK